MANFKLPSNFNPEEFRLVANGFFQAEGHVYCKIRGKSFTPILALTQKFKDFFNYMTCIRPNRIFDQ